MKTEKEIRDALSNVDEHAPSRYSGMTYEQGIAEALGWVLGDVADQEFSPLEDHG